MTFDLYGQRSRSHAKDSNFSGNNDLRAPSAIFSTLFLQRAILFHSMVALQRVSIASQKNRSDAPWRLSEFLKLSPLITINQSFKNSSA